VVIVKKYAITVTEFKPGGGARVPRCLKTAEAIQREQAEKAQRQEDMSTFKYSFKVKVVDSLALEGKLAGVEAYLLFQEANESVY